MSNKNTEYRGVKIAKEIVKTEMENHPLMKFERQGELSVSEDPVEVAIRNCIKGRQATCPEEDGHIERDCKTCPVYKMPKCVGELEQALSNYRKILATKQQTDDDLIKLTEQHTVIIEAWKEAKRTKQRAYNEINEKLLSLFPRHPDQQIERIKRVNALPNILTNIESLGRYFAEAKAEIQDIKTELAYTKSELESWKTIGREATQDLERAVAAREDANKAKAENERLRAELAELTEQHTVIIEAWKERTIALEKAEAHLAKLNEIFVFCEEHLDHTIQGHCPVCGAIENTNLRYELAEAQAELHKLREDIKISNGYAQVMHKRLLDTKAENERLRGDLEVLRPCTIKEEP